MTQAIKKHQEILRLLFLVVAASVVYLNILPNPFIWSEEAVIVDNETYKSLSYLPKFFTIKYWLEDDPFSAIQIFRPIRAVTFTLEYALWKLNPVPYHIFNIVFHAATTLMVYLLFKKIIKSRFVSFWAALFFAVHPIHTETITWTMSRDDIMCTLFPLISWWFFIKRIEARSQPGGFSRRWLFITFEAFFFTLGLLSREMAAVFPLLLCLFVIFYYPKEKWKDYLLATLPYWFIDFAYVFIHFYFWWEPLSAERFSIKLPLFNHALLVGKTIGFYLKLLLLPINLCADYYFPFFVSLAEIETRILVFLFLLFIGFIFVFLRKKLKELSFALAFTILAFLPVANIILITGRPVGEQRLYFPSIGFCLALALGLKEIGKRVNARFLTLLTLLLVGFYSYQTYIRNLDWRSPLSLWESAVAASPKTERAHRNLAGAYLASGQEDKAVLEFETILNLEETERAETEGLKLVYKKEPQPLGALVAPVMPVTDEKIICELRQKMEKEEKVRMVHPDAEIHKYLGDAYKRREDLRRAAYEYNMAIIYDPASFESYNGLGIVYDMAGFSEAAIFILDKGTKINPDFYPLYHNLGIAYEHAEKYKDAIKVYDKVIEMVPDYDQPHLRLTIIYAKYEIDKEKAKIYWEKYLKLTSRPDPEYVKEFKELLK